MLKKFMSAFLALSLMSTAGLVSAGATETKQTDNAEASEFKIIHPIIKNNITTYYDGNGNVVDITEYNRNIKVSDASLPESFDLRDEGRSTSVKNQGAEGLCWDFASTASMESSILTNPELKAQLGDNASEILDLSEVGNTWYIHTNTDDESSYLYDDFLVDESKGADGGNSEFVAMGLSSGFGAYPEELLPYSHWGELCSESLRFYSDYRLKEFAVYDNDVALIKQKLKDNGAIYISYRNFASNYNMVDEMQAYYDNGYAIDDSQGGGNHAVTIVGWDDNFSKSNFCEEMQPQNDGAWLCKNSWGEGQASQAEGYEGYFWMSYESEIREFTQFIMQSVDEFDNIYQHQYTTEDSVEVMAASNVFTAKNDEVLEQICFSNIGSADFTVDIYKLEENYTSPVDGVLLTSFESSVDFAGVHYIDVPNEVVLNAGDVFSVVLKDEDLTYISSKFDNGKDLSGKSYVATEDNEWIDVADDGIFSYLSIKALTSNKDNAVYKTELSQLVGTAKNLVIGEKVSQDIIDNLNAQLSNAENVLNDSTASQNTVNNTYCLLSSVVETIEDYYFDINSIDDYMKLYNNIINGNCKSTYIRLNTDLDLGECGEMKPLFETNSFSGVFNGNGHTISNLTVKSSGYAGFFGNISNAKIMDVNLDGCNVSGGSAAGVVAGNATNSSIINCTVENSIAVGSNSRAGGIVGEIYVVELTDCKVSETEVIGTYFAGVFACDYEAIDGLEDCVADNVTVKSNYRITDSNGATVSAFSDTNSCLALMVISDDKLSVESFVGIIKNVTSEEATISKTDSGFDVTLGEAKSAYLEVSFEEPVSTSFFFYADILTREITLTAYFEYLDETATEIEFPESIGGLPVTKISNEYYIDSFAPIKSVIFAGSIKDIDINCFSNNDDLEKITFEEGVETIGTETFALCDSLTTVNLPNSLVEIGFGAFSECRNLKNITFGENLKTISDSAFSGCRNITSIVLPDSVEFVGSGAFANCGSLSVVLGENIEEIGYSAFGYTNYFEINYNQIRIPDFTILGYSDTVAEAYANVYGFKFVDVQSEEAEIPQGSFDYGVFLKGDVNLDGVVSIMDATMIQKYLVDKAELNQIQIYNTLVGDCSSSITIENATVIQKYLVGTLDDLNSSGSKG